MKRLWVAVCASVVLGSAGRVCAAPPPDTIIHAGALLAHPGEPPRREQTVVIRAGRILEVRAGYLDAGQLGLAGEVRTVELRQAFVMPGLIDVHTHLTSGSGRGWDRASRDDVAFAFLAYENAMKTLRAGFTTVRNLGLGRTAVVGLRDAIARGEVQGPTILDSIDIISGTGGHGDEFGYREEVREVIRSPALCDGADDCRRAVRDLVRRGADVIKVAATGGVLSATNTGKGLQMEPDELRAIVQTAHRLHRRVAAHAHGTDGVNAALEAGVDSVEHGTELDDRSIELFKKTGAYMVPTLEVAFIMKERARSDPSLPDSVREKARGQADLRMASTRKARLAGVKMAFGTDASTVPHGQNAREFLRLKEAGFSPMESLRMATVNAAALLDLSDQVGSLDAGKRADIIATAIDPLDNISALLDVGFVMSRGEVVKDCFRSATPARGPDEGCR